MVPKGFSAENPEGPYRWKQLTDYLMQVMGPSFDEQNWRGVRMQRGETVGIFYGRFRTALRYSNQQISEAERTHIRVHRGATSEDPGACEDGPPRYHGRAAERSTSSGTPDVPRSGGGEGRDDHDGGTGSRSRGSSTRWAPVFCVWRLRPHSTAMPNVGGSQAAASAAVGPQDVHSRASHVSGGASASWASSRTRTRTRTRM